MGKQQDILQKRIDELNKVIISIAQLKFDKIASISDRFDDIDKLAVGLNMLSEELKASTISIREAGEKSVEILEAIISIAQLDFTNKVEIPKEYSVFAGIGVGLNMLSEELEASTVSRDYLDNIFKSMIDMLMVVNPDATIQTVNQSLLETLGYKEQELIGKHVSTIFAEEEEEEMIFKGTALEELIKKGFVRNIEKNYLTKKGNKIPVLFSGSVMYDFNGKLQGIVCVGKDITELKEIGKDLYKLSLVASKTDNYVIITNKDNKIEWVNQGFIKITGYEPNEVIGKQLSEILQGEETSREFIEQLDRTVFRERKSYQGEVLNYDKAGRKIWLSVNITPIFEEEKKITQYITIGADITKKKETEAALTLFRNLIDQSTDMVYVIEPGTGKILLANETASKMMGYHQEELLKRSIPAIKAEVTADHSWKEHVKEIKKHGAMIFESIHKRKDGTVLPVEVSTKYTTLGETNYLISIVRDTTERKKMEEEKLKRIGASAIAKAEKDRADELEKAQLANFNIMIDLDKQKNELDISLKEKEVLLREVHHRVKNNMQIIMSLMRLQSYTIKDAKLLDVFKLCQNRIKSMSFVHEDLYNSGNFKSVDFAKLARRLIVNIFDSFNINTNDIKLELDNDHVELEISDSIPSALIINELVTNSLKYAFPNGKKGKIFVSCKSSKNNVQLIVRDNGIGLPDHVNFRKPESVGLQLVNDLSYQLNGKLKYDGSKGAEFSINFVKTGE
ncbi:MAG: PAS domain S-box protein [Bacteroidetes bacterium]|nr:PAS domain S-box protein [Bacteroidota bacterium]